MLWLSFSRCLPWLIIVAFAVWPAATGFAQDTPPAKIAEQPDNTQPPADTDQPPPSTAAAAEQFDQVFAQWKLLLSNLRDLQAKYQVAEEAEMPGIRQQYGEVLAQGKAMLPKLRSTALAAYAESPNRDRNLTRFLLKMATDDVRADNYEAAAEVAQALVDGKCEEKEAYNLAGIAAFATNDFEAAEKHLNAAAAAGVLSKTGRLNHAEVAQYKDYWVKEQALRQQEAADDDLPRVKLHTSKGEITLELFENEAPETVGNFVNLVEQGFYDGLTFHRVLPRFMAQGGCPIGDGKGGPGYEIYCECDQPNHRKHFRGSISMAHSGRDSGGSQFFLTFVPTSHLNGKHTAFGRVIEGLDVLSQLQRIDPSDTKSASLEPDKIVKAEVIRKRDHKYVPNKVK